MEPHHHLPSYHRKSPHYPSNPHRHHTSSPQPNLQRPLKFSTTEIHHDFQQHHPHKFHENHPHISRKLQKHFRKPHKIKQARHLPKENDDGWIEYKTKMCQFQNPEHRINRLTTQMKFRLYQGNGVAIYNLGYLDDGHPHGMSQPILLDSLNNFFKIAKDAEAEVRSMNILKGKYGYCVNIYLVSKLPSDNEEDYFPSF